MTSRGPTVLLVAALFLAAGCLTRPPAPAPKARKLVSAWYDYQPGRSADDLRPVADLLTSISVCGALPPPEFVADCRRMGLTVYRLVPGAQGQFDTPASRDATVAACRQVCREAGFDGVDLDFMALPATWREPFNELLRMLADALHRDGKRLATTAFAPPRPEALADFFYDPEVMGRVCDQIEVMCYDLHMALGLHAEWSAIAPHVGLGPASTAPWARDSMRYWLARAPRAKLRMALPAYGNDYEMTPNGKGSQIYAPLPPVPAGQPPECLWLPYEEVHAYRYADAGNRPHLFFASDERSTTAHLATVDALGVPGLVFWNFQAVTPATWDAVRRWLAEPACD